MNFLDTYRMLENLYSSELEEDTLTEASYSDAAPINLADCRMIRSDVTDIRGELEASACLDYKGELTRVQVRTVIMRETPEGKEFLGRNYGRRIGLPGGGYDMDKDSDILDTAEREAFEEFNLILTNLKETGINVWSHRDDPWVTKHVANPDDRWTGYYTYYVTAEVSGFGDNENPEEINKWQWLPIEKLSKVNSKLAAHVGSLNEAIHPDKEGRTDLGEVSYLCDSLQTLRKILSRMEIQKTYVPEVRYEVGEKDGNTQRICQMSLSTSTNLTGHAKRRPERWGFGVILDGAVLSKYYDIEHYNHADHKLKTLALTKLVKLNDRSAADGRIIIMLGEYGNRLIPRADDSDLEIYSIIKYFLEAHPEYYKTAKLKNYYAKSEIEWRYHPFGSANGRHDSRFIHLTPDDIDELYVWPQPFSKYGIPVSQIDDFCNGRFSELLGEYSSFNEEEERIWVENNLMNFVQIPKPALTGIILPDYFKKDFESDIATNNHIAWLRQFVANNNLRVEWHEFSDLQYYKSQFDSNDTPEKELTWSNIDRITNDPETILSRARMNKARYVKGLITKQTRDQDSPPAVVATAAVKLAIRTYMSELTPENYKAKYDEALAAAKAYFAETLVKGRLTTKPDLQMTELFDYYCPDPPTAEPASDEEAV